MALKLYRSTRNFKADNYTDLSIYNKMTKEIHKKEVAKKDKVWQSLKELLMVNVIL